MSESQGGAGRREVAWRLFAAEFDDADFSYSESDEERAPNYVVTPTGARVNRLFVAGVLTEIETVSEDYLRARVVDPTGPFVVYAGQYQPDALAFLERADPPAFVAVTGKARTYEPDDSDQVFTSIRPESISDVETETRDRWVVQTAEQTVDRVTRMAEAKQSGLAGDDLRAALEAHGVDEGLAAGIPLALDHYGTTGDYLAAVRETALDAARVVAGEVDEAASLNAQPDQGGDDPVAGLVERPIDVDAVGTTGEESDDDEATAQSEPADADESAAVATEADAGDGSAIGTAESSNDTTAAAGSGTAAADAGEAASPADDSSAESPDDSPAEPAEEPAETAPDAGDTSTGGAEATTEPVETSPATDEGDAGDDAGDAGATGDHAEPETDPGEPLTESADDDAGEDDLEDFEPEFDLDEDEREEIEEEFGTEFQSGAEVDEPGSADIDAPDPDAAAEPAAADDEDETAAATAEATGAEPSTEIEDVDGTEPATEESGDDAGSEPDDADLEDVDLEDAVMEAMTDLDDGDGADRDELQAAVVDRTGADPGAVDDAIQDALMGGRCYEPDDATLKPI